MEGYQLALGPEQQELLEGLSEEEKLSMIADWQADFDLATALAASSNAPGVVPMAGAFGGKKPIYVCLGHANDILIPIPSTDRYTVDRTHVVPEGCTYATISETGQPTLMGSIYSINKLFNNRTTLPLFYDPTHNFFNINISLYRENPNILFHLTTAGNNYTNSSCTFLLHFPKEDGSVRVYKSGIYDLSNPPNTHLPQEMKDSVVIPPGGVKLDVIRKIYEGSIFPTADEVIYEIKQGVLEVFPDLSDEKINKLNYKIILLKKGVSSVLRKKGYKTQNELFTLLPPGNFYNVACRSFDDLTKVNVAELNRVRKESQRRILGFSGTALINAREDVNRTRAVETEQRIIRENFLSKKVDYKIEYLINLAELIEVGEEFNQEDIDKGISKLKIMINMGIPIEDIIALYPGIREAVNTIHGFGKTNLQMGGRGTIKKSKLRRKTNKKLNKSRKK